MPTRKVSLRISIVLALLSACGEAQVKSLGPEIPIDEIPFTGKAHPSDKYSFRIFHAESRKPVSDALVKVRIKVKGIPEMIETKTDSKGWVLYQPPKDMQSIDILLPGRPHSSAWLNLKKASYALYTYKSYRSGDFVVTIPSYKPARDIHHRASFELPYAFSDGLDVVLIVDGKVSDVGSYKFTTDGLRLRATKEHMSSGAPFVIFFGNLEPQGSGSAFLNGNIFRSKDIYWASGKLGSGSVSLEPQKTETRQVSIKNHLNNSWINMEPKYEERIILTLKGSEGGGFELPFLGEVETDQHGQKTIHIPEFPGGEVKASYYATVNRRGLDVEMGDPAKLWSLATPQISQHNLSIPELQQPRRFGIKNSADFLFFGNHSPRTTMTRGRVVWGLGYEVE